MGSPKTEPCREPTQVAVYGKETQHEVVLIHGFVIQRTEVTQGELLAVMGYPSNYHPSCSYSCPAAGMTWHMAASYCNKLSMNQGMKSCYVCTGYKYDAACKVATAYKGKAIYNCPGYRLPTEAEWEYAYRAGTTTAYYSGAMKPSSCIYCSAEPSLNSIGWYCGNTGSTYTPTALRKVGGLDPNGWGLYDIAGNAWEWCHDGFVNNLGAKKLVDPVNTTVDGDHVYRGGAASYEAMYARAAIRGRSKAGSGVGVRCVRTVSP